MLRRRPLLLAASALPLVATGRRAALAQGGAAGPTLTIGTKLDPSSLDPHFFNGTENNNALAHVFERLIGLDPEGRLRPALAESWRSTAPTTWEIKLRRGVRFHDGSPFTARDVAFTVARVPKVENSPGPFTAYVRNITSLDIVDDHTLRLTTQRPDPFLPRDLARVFVVPASLGEGVRTADFNTIRATIGTGPYRLVEYVPSDRLVFVRNDAHWGGRPDWARVVIRPNKSDASRTAALLAGDVDMIDFPAAADLASMRRRPEFQVLQHPAARIMYVQMDHDREVSPHAVGPDGKNPLRDVRVRRALSLALNRQAIVDRVLDGAGTPAGQMPVPGQPGASDKLAAPAQDMARARALLAEAGYPNGFRLTIHGTSDRYPGGDRVVQAMAQYYSRLGLDVTVQLVPNAAFFPAASRREYSFFFGGYGSDDASVYLRTVMHSNDRARGLGSSNRGYYANPRVDEMVRAAIIEMDDEKRERMMAQAFEIAEGEDVAVISIYYPSYDYVLRRDRVPEYTAHTMGYTWAMLAKPPAA
jgi:peptide/nickel transport system substrate-binding protein